MSDVTSPSSGETEEQKPTEESSSVPDDVNSVEETEGQPKGKAPKAVPYDRFQKVNAKAAEYEKVVKWYQEQIKDADELLAFKQWQASQAESANKKSSKTDDDEPLDPKNAE